MDDTADEAPARSEKNEFVLELEKLINRHSLENGSNTPDFILAAYLKMCLLSFDSFINLRESWYGRETTTSEKAGEK